MSAPKHAARLPFALLLLGLFGGGMVLLLVLNTASAANEVARHDLASRDASVAAGVEDLQVRVANSAAPDNLLAAAEQLGMVPGGNPAFLVVGPDGRVVVKGIPGAVTAPPLARPSTSAKKKSPAPTRTSTSVHPPSTGARKTPTSSRTSPAAQTSNPPTTPRATPTPTPTFSLPGGDR